MRSRRRPTWRSSGRRALRSPPIFTTRNQVSHSTTQSQLENAGRLSAFRRVEVGAQKPAASRNAERGPGRDQNPRLRSAEAAGAFTTHQHRSGADRSPFDRPRFVLDAPSLMALATVTNGTHRRPHRPAQLIHPPPPRHARRVRRQGQGRLRLRGRPARRGAALGRAARGVRGRQLPALRDCWRRVPDGAVALALRDGAAAALRLRRRGRARRPRRARGGVPGAAAGRHGRAARGAAAARGHASARGGGGGRRVPRVPAARPLAGRAAPAAAAARAAGEAARVRGRRGAVVAGGAGRGPPAAPAAHGPVDRPRRRAGGPRRHAARVRPGGGRAAGAAGHRELSPGDGPGPRHGGHHPHPPGESALLRLVCFCLFVFNRRPHPPPLTPDPRACARTTRP